MRAEDWKFGEKKRKNMCEGLVRNRFHVPTVWVKRCWGPESWSGPAFQVISDPNLYLTQGKVSNWPIFKSVSCDWNKTFRLLKQFKDFLWKCVDNQWRIWQTHFYVKKVEYGIRIRSRNYFSGSGSDLAKKFRVWIHNNGVKIWLKNSRTRFENWPCFFYKKSLLNV